MSITIKGVSKQLLATLTMASVVLSLAGFAAMPTAAQAVAPADYGLREGDTISASGSSDPDIYIVNDWGYKRLFVNPAIFTLYGHLSWAGVKSVSPATRDAFGTSGLFRNCETGDQKVYGLDVISEDVANLRWVNTTGAQAVIDDPNFFKKVFCINTREMALYGTGADYTSVLQVPVYSRGGVTPPPAGNLSASLSSDNPASGTLVETQALADLAHFQVGGSGAITTLQLKRLGVSGDTALEDVFLFVNGVRVSDAGNVSSGFITFNNAAGLFNAPATVVVKSDIAASTSGQTVGVQLTMLNAQSFMISGNIHSIAAAPTLASVSVGAATGTGNFDPSNDVAVWRSTVTISNEDVYVKRMTVREIGSVDSADVRNLRLFINGVQVATAAGLDSEGYATFNLNYRVITGSPEFKILADVVGGSTRTISFSLRGSYDLEVMDEAYNVGVEASNSFPITAAAGTIGGGSVTVTKATNSPSGDVVDDATDVVLARYELKAFGEAVKIETISAIASVSDTNIVGLSNGRLMIGGVQYGNTTTLVAAAPLESVTSTSFTVNYTLAAGATVILEVRADMKESASGTDVSANDVISIILDGGDNNNAYGVSSANQVDVPTTSLEGNNVTVTAATATLSKQSSYSDQAVTLPQTDFKIGSWVLTGSSAEAINLTTFSFDIDAMDGSTFTEADLSNMVMKLNGVAQGSPKATPTAANNDYNVSRVLGINEVLVVELFASLGTNVTTTDSVNADLSVTGTGASSGVAVSNSDVEGQEIDTAAGVFATSVDSGSAKLVLSNSTVSAGQWRFRGDNENFKVSELRFKFASTSNEELAVSKVTLKQNGVAIAEYPNGLSLSLATEEYVATFDNTNIMTGLNSEAIVTLDIETADVNTNVATGKNVFATLEYAKYTNTNGVEATDNTDRIGSSIYVHDGIPTLAKTGSNVGTTLTAGIQSLAEFSVTPAGNLGVKRIRFDISKSTTIGFASASFKIYENGVDITSVASHSDSANEAGTSEGPGSTSLAVSFEFNSERTLNAATTYRLEGNLSTFAQSTNLTTTINVDAATAAPTTYALVSSASTFVWTDRSAISHAEGSADWMNSYLLQSLPLSWSKSVGQ